jgi:hypothetical protein
MFRWFWRLLYESIPTEFPSAFGLVESVERLRAATKRSVFSSLGETAAVGKVSEDGVRLQRVIPMMRNGFKPFFIGRFEVRDGVTVLSGRFTMALFAKIFMSFWFGMLLAIGGGIWLGTSHSAHSVPRLILLQPFLMAGFGVALVAAGKWFARNDVAWLSSVIRGALGEPNQSASAAMMVAEPADPEAVPTTLKIVSILMAVSGALQLVGRFQPGDVADGGRGPWPVIPSSPFGNWTIALGAGLLVVAVGVWRRQPWAWWAGFLVLGLSWLNFLFVLHGQGGIGPPIAFRVIFNGIALIVTGIWGWWWYAQRKHFLWE